MEFVADPDMRKLADRVVSAYPEQFCHIDLDRVLFYLEISGCMSKAVAKCRKVTSPWGDILREYGCDADWVIEFYSVHTAGKSDKWLAIVMFHELLHIGDDGKIVPHNVEDFALVLRMAGIGWSGDDQNVPDIIRKKIRLVA